MVVRNLLTEEAKERLSELCLRLRGDQPLRKFTPRTGISPSSWGAWETKTGYLGIQSSQKLAAFVGTSPEELQVYLNGGMTLDTYLRIPLIPKTVNKDKESLSKEFATSVEQVISWMHSLNLKDLAQIVEAGSKLMREATQRLNQSDKPKDKVEKHLTAKNQKGDRP